MSLRDYDPETYLEDREADRRLDDEGNPAGTRDERALEALVHGDTYRDWHGQRGTARDHAIMRAQLATARALGRGAA